MIEDDVQLHRRAKVTIGSLLTSLDLVSDRNRDSRLRQPHRQFDRLSRPTASAPAQLHDNYLCTETALYQKSIVAYHSAAVLEAADMSLIGLFVEFRRRLGGSL